jgi:hypothetical protein
LHVDDYISSPSADPVAKEFLQHARLPSIKQDYKWLRANSPLVTWQGAQYRCVGASRLGDVWLKSLNGPDPDSYYDYRVSISELSGWTRPEL